MLVKLNALLIILKSKFLPAKTTQFNKENMLKNKKLWTGYPTVHYFMSMQIIHKNKNAFSS